MKKMENALYIFGIFLSILSFICGICVCFYDCYHRKLTRIEAEITIIPSPV